MSKIGKTLGQFICLILIFTSGYSYCQINQEASYFLNEKLSVGIYQLLSLKDAESKSCDEVVSDFKKGVIVNAKWFTKVVSKIDGGIFVRHHKNLMISEADYVKVKECAKNGNKTTQDTFQLRLALDHGIRRFDIETEGPENLFQHIRIIPEDNQLMVGAMPLYYRANPSNYYEKFKWNLEEVHSWFGQKKLRSGMEKYEITIGREKDSSRVFFFISIFSPENAKSDNSAQRAYILRYLRDR